MKTDEAEIRDNAVLLLKQTIIATLQEQGFSRNGDGSFALATGQREAFRQVQDMGRREQLQQHVNFLLRELPEARRYGRDGSLIDPTAIELELRLVSPGTLEERLFRWWNIVWWSIPYQRSYGRRLRFLIWDKAHDAPFGLIGLHSPSLKMAVRDEALGIRKEERDFWVNMALSAQRVGALPPYNELLGGKLVALTLTANELRAAYRQQYENRPSIMLGRLIPAYLLFITTTGAFGRTSIYNRLSYYDHPVASLLGYTKGSGSFHIPDALFGEIVDFLKTRGIDVTGGYGHGPSRKRQLLNIASRILDLPSFEYHGIPRAFYVFPHVSNLKQVIAKRASPQWYDRPFAQLWQFWKQRWAIPRSERTSRWRDFKAADFFEETQRMLEGLRNGKAG